MKNISHMKASKDSSHAAFYPLCFDTLGNELRVKILHELETGHQSVEDLASRLKVERSRVSHALSPLLECQHVHVERKGKHRLYALNPKAHNLTINGKNVFAVMDEHIACVCNHECKRLSGH